MKSRLIYGGNEGEKIVRIFSKYQRGREKEETRETERKRREKVSLKVLCSVGWIK